MRWILFVLVLLNGLSASAQDARLIMFEEEGCYWCAQWHDELGAIYPKTTEGQRAPLMQVDLSDGIPSELELTPAPFFTPTFVLIYDGKEYGRIEGYPGEDFFWGLLGTMIAKLPAEPS